MVLSGKKYKFTAFLLVASESLKIQLFVEKQSCRGGSYEQITFLVWLSMTNEPRVIHVLASQVVFTDHVFYENFRALPKKFKMVFLQKPPMDNLKIDIFPLLRLCTKLLCKSFWVTFKWVLEPL